MQPPKTVKDVSPVVAAGILLLLSVLLYLPTWSALVDRWYTDPGTYGHGFLVAAVSIYLILICAKEVSPDQSNRPWFLGALLLAVSTVWLIFHISDILIGQAMLMPVILLLGFAIAFGARSSSHFIFPVAYLYFSVPFWGYMNGILQDATILVVSWILAAASITAMFDGELIHIPSGTFRIASGCAGLHFFIVAFALSTFYAYLCFRTKRIQVAFVALALMVAILTNWIRVAVIIVAGYMTDMQHYLVAVDHYNFGWYLFVAMLIPLYFLGRMFEQHEKTLDAVTQDKKAVGGQELNRLSLNAVIVAAVLLAFIPAFGVLVERAGRTNGDFVDRIEIPATLTAWRWEESSPGRNTPYFYGADTEITGRYVRTDIEIDVYVNRYAIQSQGKELISDNNRFVNRNDYQELSVSTKSLKLDSGDSFDFGHVVAVARDGSQRELYFWYQVGAVPLLTRISVKIEEFKARFSKNAGSGVIVLGIDCRNDCDGKSKMLEEFVVMHAKEIAETAF